METDQSSMDYLHQCILCGKNADEFLKPYSRRDGYDIVQCKNCGLIFVNPRDNQKSISKQYSEDITSNVNYYSQSSKVDRISFNKKIRWLEEKVSGRRLLDIGCNVGTFMEVARNRGWEVIGLDANKGACEICREKKITVYEGFFSNEFIEPLKREHFDLVCMNDAIEHFPNPLLAVKLVSDLLPSGSFFLITTPNIDSVLARIFQIKPKEHLFYFNKKTISEILTQSGFVIEILRTIGRERAIGAMHCGSSIHKRWYFVSRFLSVTRLDGIISTFLKLFFEDELFVLARKV